MRCFFHSEKNILQKLAPFRYLLDNLAKFIFIDPDPNQLPTLYKEQENNESIVIFSLRNMSPRLNKNG